MSDSESEPNDICGETVLKKGFKTDRWFHVSDAKDQMDVVRQSDGSVVSTKSANNDASEASAEWMEKRDQSREEHRPGQPIPGAEPGQDGSKWIGTCA